MNKVLLAIFLTVFLTGFFLLTDRPVYAADVTPPVTNYTMTPSEPDGNNDWFTSIITFELEAIDLQSGVKEIWYKISNNPWQIVEFNDTVNRAPNPSFEVAGSTTTGLQYWEATVQDASTIYSQDQNEYHPDF